MPWNRRYFTMVAVAVVFSSGLRLEAAPPNWPQFRGPGASGIADGQNVPITWDISTGANIKWTTPIPGLAHSSPVVWGERVYVTSAVSEGSEQTLHTGMNLGADDYSDDAVHEFRIYGIDRPSGRILWEKTAHSGVPKSRRHPKSTQASSTPATDGTHVVALFGPEGLYCYDSDGKLLWKKDLGPLDSSAFYDPKKQWGFASSPIIHDGRVIVQCDVLNGSFLAAYDIDDGTLLWRTARDEVATWSTPTVYVGGGDTQIIVNGYKQAGAYDANTGAALWQLASSCSIPIPTPVTANGLVYLTGCFGGDAPIYAIRAEARGTVKLEEGARTNDSVVWSLPRRGSYVPTPIVYRGYLYIGSERGTLTCYDATSGEQKYRTRVAGIGAYSASPVAADGRLYFTSEDGDIHVIKAGPEYELLATNRMNEPCLATPAIAAGMIFIRTQHTLYGIGE